MKNVHMLQHDTFNRYITVAHMGQGSLSFSRSAHGESLFESALHLHKMQSLRGIPIHVENQADGPHTLHHTHGNMPGQLIGYARLMWLRNTCAKLECRCKSIGHFASQKSKVPKGHVPRGSSDAQVSCHRARHQNLRPGVGDESLHGLETTGCGEGHSQMTYLIVLSNAFVKRGGGVS